MKPFVRMLSMGAMILGFAGCGGSAPPPGEATAVEGADGVVVQEEWPDEVKQAEANFQQSASDTAKQQGR